MQKKRPRTEKSDTETKAVGGEAGPSQDQEAIVKDHEELYNNTTRTKQGRSVSGSSLPTVTSCLSRCARPGLGSQRTCYGKLTKLKSGQASKEMTENQNWIQDKFGFLRSHIRCKRLGILSGFKLQARGASASAHNTFRASTDTDSMGISMWSADTTLQPQQVMSPTAASGHSSVD